MSKYMRKPVVVDAIEYVKDAGMEDGLVAHLVDLKNEEYYDKTFSGKNCWKAYERLIKSLEDNKHTTIDRPAQPYINTIEGKKFISKGDYIITGTLGERYLCHPDIFKENYSAIEE